MASANLWIPAFEGMTMTGANQSGGAAIPIEFSVNLSLQALALARLCGRAARRLRRGDEVRRRFHLNRRVVEARVGYGYFQLQPSFFHAAGGGYFAD